MDCNHARLLLTFARDRAALDSGEADHLEQHLSQCPECAALAASEQRLDAALTKAMREVPVPAGLKSRLLSRLPRPGRLRRYVVSALAAAVLLLAVGVSLRLMFPSKPEIAFANEPFLVCRYHKPSAPEVEAWFDNHGFTMIFPEELKLKIAKLASLSIDDWHGHRVPKLEFLESGHIAHVYVFSPDRFEFDVNTIRVDSHLRVTNARSMDSFTRNGYFYLIVYTGSSPRTFQ